MRMLGFFLSVIVMATISILPMLFAVCESSILATLLVIVQTMIASFIANKFDGWFDANSK